MTTIAMNKELPECVTTVYSVAANQYDIPMTEITVTPDARSDVDPFTDDADVIDCEVSVGSCPSDSFVVTVRPGETVVEDVEQMTACCIEQCISDIGSVRDVGAPSVETLLIDTAARDPTE